MTKPPKTKEGKPCVRIKITSKDGAVLIYEMTTNCPNVPAQVEAVTREFLAQLETPTSKGERL